MTDAELRDYFAAHAPLPTPDDMERERKFDRARNPHNDSYKPKIREDIEIVADFAYQYADAMMAARRPDAYWDKERKIYT